MSRIQFANRTIVPSAEMSDLIQRLAPDNYEGDERRSEERTPVVAVVPAVEVDKDYQPVGAEFTVVTRNISTRGISLLHEEKISATHLAIELPGDQEPKPQVVMEIIHSRQVGDAYEIGGKFVAKM